MKSKLRLPWVGFVLLVWFMSLTCLLSCTGKKSGGGSGFSSTFHSDDGSLSVFHGFEKDDVKTWDPANAYDSVSSDLVLNIYESLFQYVYLSNVYQVEPLLAASMPVYSKDRLTVTIPLKKGVKFQDDPCFKETNGKGRELKAQDFIYAWKRLALSSLQSAGWWVFDEKIVGVNKFKDHLTSAAAKDVPSVFEEAIEGMQALDDYTLQLKLTKPYPQLPFVLSLGFTAPVAKEAVNAYADERGNLTDHPVGTGPFLLKSWQRNHEIVLDRNPNFREEKYPSSAAPEYENLGMLADVGKNLPLVDRLRILVLKEEQPRWLTFKSGQLDQMLLPKDNFAEAISEQSNLRPELVKKGIHLGIETGVITRYISFNMKDKTLGSNKHLRQALSSAIDREKWIQIFTNGTAKKMAGFVPPGISDRPEIHQMKYDFNLARAKDLLKKAGYPNGQGLPVLKFDLRGSSTSDRQMGDFFATQFAQIGVRVEVVANTFPAFLQKLKEGNLQISYGGWQMDYPDAENIYQLMYSPNQPPGPNETSYHNPAFDRLFEQMSVLDSGAKRRALNEKMDEMIQEDCPVAMGYYEASYHLSQPWFMNYRGAEMISNKYKYYRVDQEIKKRYSSGV